MDVVADLTISGATHEMPATVIVTRLGPDRVQVKPAGLLVVDAGLYDLEEGVAMLASLAGLDSISLAVPTTFRFVFERQSPQTV
jgi:hypothetical protein